MLKLFLLVGCGGFLGSVARYACSLLAARYFLSAFPYGTFGVNIAGSLLIGLLCGLPEKGGVLPPESRLFFVTGFCGGFTTFSAFTFETLALLRAGAYWSAGLYVVGSVVLGLAATYAGMVLVSK